MDLLSQGTYQKQISFGGESLRERENERLAGEILAQMLHLLSLLFLCVSDARGHLGFKGR